VLRINRGDIFDRVNARLLSWLGLVVILSVVSDQICAALDPWLLSWLIERGALALRWAYDPSDYKAMTLGVVIFVFGWVLRAAMDVETEHRGFI